jgi:hypothetical protein
MLDLPSATEPTIEFLILADHVEAINGKLYMMGGGIENYGVLDFGAPIIVGFAVSIQVPWHATNRQHTVSVSIQSSDGIALGGLDGQFSVGRPPTIEDGASQRTMIAAKMPLTLPAPGTYVVLASINGQPGTRVTFRAAQVALPQLQS